MAAPLVVHTDRGDWRSRVLINALAPLRLREPGGGIPMDGTTVVKDPRVQLVGLGTSASTLGATRAGRVAALKACPR